MTAPELPVPVVDPDTLQESYADPAAARALVTELRDGVRQAPDEIGELVARGDLVDVLRTLGELDDALREARAAADRAEIAGTRAQQHVARLRLAHVHLTRGEYAESTPILTELLAVATRFGPVVEAYTHQLAGLNDFGQAHWGDARDHFARALALRDELELDDAERAASRTARDAAAARADAPRRAQGPGTEEGT